MTFPTMYNVTAPAICTFNMPYPDCYDCATFRSGFWFADQNKNPLGNIIFLEFNIVQWTNYADETVVNITYNFWIPYCIVQFYLSPNGYIELGCADWSLGLGLGLFTIVPPWVSQIAWFGILNISLNTPTGFVFQLQYCYTMTAEPYIPLAIPPPNTAPCTALPLKVLSFNLTPGMFASFILYPSMSGACAPSIWITIPAMNTLLHITTVDGTIQGLQTVIQYNLAVRSEYFVVYNGTFLNILQPTMLWIAIANDITGYLGVDSSLICKLDPGVFSYINLYGAVFTFGFYSQYLNMTVPATIYTPTDWQITEVAGTQSLESMCTGYNPPSTSIVTDILFFDIHPVSIIYFLCDNYTGIVWYNDYVQVWITFLGLTSTTASVSITFLDTVCQSTDFVSSFAQYYQWTTPLGNSSFITYDTNTGNLVLGRNLGNISNPLLEVMASISLNTPYPPSFYPNFSNMRWGTTGPGILSVYGPPSTSSSTNSPSSSTNSPSLSTTGPSSTHSISINLWILYVIGGGILLVLLIVVVSMIVYKQRLISRQDPEHQPINSNIS